MKHNLKTFDSKIERIHFVGIGGIGMSGIAEIFRNLGYLVSGSDISETETTRRLESLGIKVSIGHRAQNVDGASVVVVTSAIKAVNPELLEAKRLKLPVIQRAEMLGELMRFKTGFAIAGTHGKTTTTSMLSTVLAHLGYDPTVVVGGKVDALGGNARLGASPYLVAEADESDGSFLKLPATYNIITNIDNDHLDHYGTLSRVEDAFVQFANQTPFHGLSVLCLDDPGVRKIVQRLHKPFVTYGFSEEADFKIVDYSTENGDVKASQRFFLKFKSENLGPFEIGFPGKHQVLNAAAVAALCLKLGLEPKEIREGLLAFGGVRRRFEIKYSDSQRKIVVIDDYGHHPTEIQATLSAARGYWKDRIVTVFEPHRYTRTRDCWSGFLHAFTGTDVLLLTEIYPASEDPIENVSGERLLREIKGQLASSQQAWYVGDLVHAKSQVLSILKEGDLILCLGAGAVTKLSDELAKELGGNPKK